MVPRTCVWSQGVVLGPSPSPRAGRAVRQGPARFTGKLCGEEADSQRQWNSLGGMRAGSVLNFQARTHEECACVCDGREWKTHMINRQRDGFPRRRAGPQHWAEAGRWGVGLQARSGAAGWAHRGCLGPGQPARKGEGHRRQEEAKVFVYVTIKSLL